MEPKTDWWAGYARQAASWIRRNPVILLIFLVLIALNSLGFGQELTAYYKFRLTGAYIIDTAMAVSAALANPWAAAAAGAGAVASAGATVFEVGSMIAVFRGQARPIRRGIEDILSWATIRVFAFSVVTYVLAIGLGTGAGYCVVVGLGLKGVAGGALAVTIAAAAYALTYTAISVAAILLVPPLPLADLKQGAATMLRRRNLNRLFAFYTFRVGLETVLLCIGFVLCASFRVPPLLAIALLILIGSAPFAFVRTTGFALKLDMLEPVPWFNSSLGSYYASATENHSLTPRAVGKGKNVPIS